MKRILTLLVVLHAIVIGPSNALAGEHLRQNSNGVAARRVAAANPFAGTYCGYLDNFNSGSLSISNAGDVGGYFSYFIPNYSESYKLSGRVSNAGVMQLKIVHTITVSDRGRRTRTERYSVTLTVALDDSGNLLATSGASFVLAPCL
jgi:hypothetical protein